MGPAGSVLQVHCAAMRFTSLREILESEFRSFQYAQDTRRILAITYAKLSGILEFHPYVDACQWNTLFTTN